MDKIRLERVIDNLLDNAVKYSPPNTRIDVATLDLGDYIQISVSDEGKGISQEDQARLFSPFERLSEGATSKPGLGLGLLVCRRLVEAHGGKIWVESVPGNGSTFIFTLPAAGKVRVNSGQPG